MTAAAASTSSASWIAVHQVSAAQLDEVGDLGVDGGRDLRAQVVHVDARRLHGLPERRPQGRRLEVREQSRDTVGAERVDGRGDRALGSGDGGGGDEQLDAVGLQLIRAR